MHHAAAKVWKNYQCKQALPAFGVLAAYYSKGCDSACVFSKLKIAEVEGYQKHLNAHNVIFIDFSRKPDQCEEYITFINDIFRKLREDISAAYNLISNDMYQLTIC